MHLGHASMKKRLKTLVGLKFGYLYAKVKMHLHRFPNGKRQSVYLCRCVCGNEVQVLAGNLRSGHTKSCGCVTSVVTHGMYNHPVCHAWYQMRARCNNKDHKAYKHYGGRGIKICNRWSKFDNFKSDMFPKWTKGLTLERKDVNGDYCPENCIWIPQRDQINNTRRTRKWEFKGALVTTRDLASMAGVSTHAMYCRLVRGVVPETAVSQPSGTNYRI